MKIDTIWGNKDAPVAAYFDSKGVRYYIYVTDRQAERASIGTAEHCTVVDEDVTHFTTFVNRSGQTVWLDTAAGSEKLLDAMLMSRPDAMAGFWSALDARS